MRVRNREVGQSMIAREKPHERRKEGPRDEGARERVAPGGAGSRRFARELEPPPPRASRNGFARLAEEFR